MAFRIALKEEIEKYILGHLPNEEWYNEHFYPFIDDLKLRERLIIEYKNARAIYKFFEGMQAENELLLAQIKIQVIMFVSIQEAVINYVLFTAMKSKIEVQALLIQERLVKIDIPEQKQKKISLELEHDDKKIVTCFYKEQKVDITKIRYDQKIKVVKELGLISEKLAGDLIQLYEYRNTIHIEAEMKKNLTYDLEMGELAYRRVEGLNIELVNNFFNS